MAPTNANNSVSILQQGIDTIVLNVWGDLRPDVLDCLAISKEDAQTSEDDWALSPLPPFDGSTPQTHASGVRFYDYLCRSKDVTVRLRRPGRVNLPAAIIRVSAQALWRLGGGGQVAARLAAEYLTPLFDQVERVQVGAVHLATDYQGWAPAPDDLPGLVKRADKVSTTYGDDLALESLAAGDSRRIRLNWYDKTRQVKQKGLEWVMALWEASNSYDAQAPVWRLEYQFGREALRSFGLDTLDQLCDQLGALWAYATDDWFSLRIVTPSDQEHRHRWPVDPRWAALTPWGAAVADPLPRVKVVRPDLHRLCAGALGYLTSVMALCEVGTAGEGLSWLLHEVRAMKGADVLQRSLERKRRRYALHTMAAA